MTSLHGGSAGLEANPQPHNQQWPLGLHYRHLLCSRFMTVYCSGEMENVLSCLEQLCTYNRAKQKIRASTGGYTADSQWGGRERCLLYLGLGRRSKQE